MVGEECPPLVAEGIPLPERGEFRRQENDIHHLVGGFRHQKGEDFRRPIEEGIPPWTGEAHLLIFQSESVFSLTRLDNMISSTMSFYD